MLASAQVAPEVLASPPQRTIFPQHMTRGRYPTFFRNM